MVDLFQAHYFVTFLNNSYPTLKLTVRYDFSTFILYIQIELKEYYKEAYYKNVEYYSGQFLTSDTKECISHIDDIFTAYLAYLSHMRIKL